MAYEIKWTKMADLGYARIVKNLEERWGEKVVENYIKETNSFFELLKTQPRLLQPTKYRKYVYRGPITKSKLTMLTYRVKPRKKIIELVNIRDSRMKPLKR